MATDHLPAAQTSALLQAFGYPAPSTDEFTAELRDQIQVFQDDCSLHRSGIVTLEVQRRLLSRPTLRSGDERIEVRAFQQALRERGYRLRITGVFGIDEVNALNEYQGQVGITRSGVVDTETWEALGWLPEAGPSAP